MISRCHKLAILIGLSQTLLSTGKSCAADETKVERQHPLVPVVNQARASLQHIDDHIRNYKCRTVRRERIGDRLLDYQYMTATVRHEQLDAHVPFAVLLKFAHPKTVRGRVVLFVEGMHAGRMFVRKGGMRLPSVSMMLEPQSRLAKRESRNSIQSFGIRRLLLLLIEIAEHDIENDTPTKVQFFKDAKIGDRTCLAVEVVHPFEEDCKLYHRAKIYLDEELNIPVHFESYGWPTDTGEERLLELYSYSRFEFNLELAPGVFEASTHGYTSAGQLDATEHAAVFKEGAGLSQNKR